MKHHTAPAPTLKPPVQTQKAIPHIDENHGIGPLDSSLAVIKVNIPPGSVIGKRRLPEAANTSRSCTSALVAADVQSSANESFGIVFHREARCGESLLDLTYRKQAHLVDLFVALDPALATDQIMAGI